MAPQTDHTHPPIGHDGARQILTDYLTQLPRHGYTRTAVDTFTQINGASVTHHYSGGEFELKIIEPNIGPDGTGTRTRKLKWSIRDTNPPTVEELIALTPYTVH